MRVRIAGICGTDLELVRGYMTFEGVAGHEFVGEVVATARLDLAGKRVVGEINAACGECEWCARGLGRHCPRRTVLGILGRDGAFADISACRTKICSRSPPPYPTRRRSSLNRSPPRMKSSTRYRCATMQKIVVLGDGRLGAMVAMTLAAEGLKPVVAGHHRDKLRSTRSE